jgi:ABC-type glycerol-3-phosphate transport system substrate-binding protein
MSTGFTTRRTFVAGAAVGAAATLGIPFVARAAAPVKVWTFIDPKDTSVRAKTLAHVFNTFQAKNPGVTIEPSVMQWNMISSSFLRAHQSGQVPDLVMIYSPDIPVHIAAGTIAPLTPRVASWPKADRDDIVILPNAREGNDIFGLPWELRTYGHAVNLRHLKEAGISVPDSLPALGEAAGRIAKTGKVGLSIALNPADPSATLLSAISILAGLGGRLLNDKGGAAFDSPAGERVAQYFYDIVNTYQAIPVETALQMDEAAHQLVESGRATFGLSGTQRMSLMRQKLGIGADLAWIPCLGMTPGKASPANVEGWQLAIPTKASNKDGAWTLIEHWTSHDMQRYQTEQATYMPMRLSVADAPVFNSDTHAFLKTAIRYAKENQLTLKKPENNDMMFDVLARALGSVVQKKQSPKVALAAAAKDYDSKR